MSDAALSPSLPLGGASFDGLAAIRETGPQGMVQIRGDLSDVAVQTALSDITGSPMPGLRAVTASGDHALLWMSPDEVMLLLPYDDVPDAVKALSERLSGRHALVQPLSDARAHFILTGDPGRIREVLAKLAPVDLSPDAFPPMTLRRTRLAQVPAGFWITQTGAARLFCFRSVARYTFDLLGRAAAPHSAVDHF